jgi:hypothetical protein
MQELLVNAINARNMISTKYVGMDVHKKSISIAVRNFIGKVVMECVIETKPA